MTLRDDSELQLITVRFEYAWRYFALHAQQRITMFHLFLLGSGVLANAYALLLTADMYVQAGIVASMGCLLSLVAIMLEIRNHQLAKFGQEALRRIEVDYLALSGQLESGHDAPEYLIFTHEREMGEAHWLFKHKFLIRSLEGTAVVGFLLAALDAFR